MLNAFINLAVEELVSHLYKIQEETKKHLKKAAQQMKQQVDKKSRDSKEYKIEDLVFLDDKNITTIRPTKKLDDKWFGPFEILDKIGNSVYKLKLPIK